MPEEAPPRGVSPALVSEKTSQHLPVEVRRLVARHVGEREDVDGPGGALLRLPRGPGRVEENGRGLGPAAPGPVDREGRPELRPGVPVLEVPPDGENHTLVPLLLVEPPPEDEDDRRRAVVLVVLAVEEDGRDEVRPLGVLGPVEERQECETLAPRARELPEERES